MPTPATQIPDLKTQPTSFPSLSTSPIDRLTLDGLARRKLTPQPAADRATLIRRLSFDLTGLPPSLAEIDAFLADRSPDALPKVVDRLLASPPPKRDVHSRLRTNYYNK